MLLRPSDMSGVLPVVVCGEINKKEETETMAMHQSGELRRRANDATRRSGYGALRDDQDRIVKILTPSAFEDSM